MGGRAGGGPSRGTLPPVRRENRQGRLPSTMQRHRRCESGARRWKRWRGDAVAEAASEVEWVKEGDPFIGGMEAPSRGRSMPGCLDDENKVQAIWARDRPSGEPTCWAAN